MPSEAQLQIPFRIRIGITGHRTLPHETRVRAAVQRVVHQEIEALYYAATQAHPPQPLYEAVTALADGTDQVVASEILKMPGSAVEAVLPLEESEYRATISDAGMAAFDQLLRADRDPRRMRRLTLEQEFPGRSAEDLQTKRDAAYDAAGRYVVDHCDVLIAVWDQAPAPQNAPPHSRPPGEGTRRTVSYAKTRKRPVIIIDPHDPESISVDWGNGLNARAVPALARFNNLSANPRKERAACEAVTGQIFGGSQSDGIWGAARVIPESTRNLMSEILIPAYVKAERIAHSNQNAFRFAGAGVYWLAVLSVVFVGLGELYRNGSAGGFLVSTSFRAESVCLVIILLIVWFSRKASIHQKWFESRFLAERLRSSFYVTACGMEPSPVEVPPYLAIAHRPDDWMVRAFTEIWRSVPVPPKLDPQDCGAYAKFIRVSWIQGQVQYHKKKAKRCELWDRTLEYSGLGFFFIALLAALFHAFDWGPASFHPGLNFAASVTPAVGAALAGIRALGGYHRLAKRSHQMVNTLLDLDADAADVNDAAGLEALVREVEELMLRETQEWLMLVRFVKLETP